jgi:hypothetical protein
MKDNCVAGGRGQPGSLCGRRSNSHPAAIRGQAGIKVALSSALPLLGLLAAGSTLTAPTLAPDTVASLRPTWTIGDWWVVESQVYDRGEKRADAVPGWVDKEAWLFRAMATNAIAGESCYELSIRPGAGNRCPYWFSCWFRVSDLLVMRRQLHQPTATRTGRPFSVSAVQTDYAIDYESPFVPSDFPNLPLTMPHFAGGQTNHYVPKPAPIRGVSPLPAASRKSPRSLGGSVTQTFHPNQGMEQERAKLPDASTLPKFPETGGRFGVIVLDLSGDKYERQSWHRDLPWHVYGEKCEHGVTVRRSWLAALGHATSGPASPAPGGAQ